MRIIGSSPWISLSRRTVPRVVGQLVVGEDAAGHHVGTHETISSLAGAGAPASTDSGRRPVCSTADLREHSCRRVRAPPRCGVYEDARRGSAVRGRRVPMRRRPDGAVPDLRARRHVRVRHRGRDGGDRRLQRRSWWPTATGCSPAASGRPTPRPSSTGGTRSRCSPTGRTSSRRSTWPVSGSSTPPTSTWRCGSRRRGRSLQPAGRAPAAPRRRMTDVADAITRVHREEWARVVAAAGPALRQPRPRRGDGRRGVRDRRRALAGRRGAAEPRRVAHHHRPPQGHRPDPPRGQARGRSTGRR